MKRLFLVCALGIIGILGACSLSLLPAANPVVVAVAKIGDGSEPSPIFD